jgi:hypothetical protein
MPTITIALNAEELSTADLAVVGGIVQAALRRCGYVDAHRDGPAEAVAIGLPGASYEFRSLTITEQQPMVELPAHTEIHCDRPPMDTQPHGPCTNCNQRPATAWWCPSGTLGFVHGYAVGGVSSAW